MFNKILKMKKILLYAIAGFSLALTSCKSDEEEANNPYSESNLIVGVWKESKEVTISGADNSTVLDTYMVTGCDALNNFNFKSDGGYVENIYDNATSGTGCNLDSTKTGSYSYDPLTKALTINYSGGTTGIENLTVLAVNASSLVVKNKIDDDNGDGIDDFVIITLYR